MNKNNKTFKLTFSAIMIALSTALSFIKIFKLPWGGSVTLLSMLPVCMISIAFGTAYAISPCILYGAVQMIVDGVFAWGLTPKILAASIFLDYLAAFGILSLAGVFRSKGTKGIYGGIVLSAALRLIFHIISGRIFFEQFAVQELVDFVGGNPFIYSTVYNGAYMLPEIGITLAAAFIIFRMESVKRIILD